MINSKNFVSDSVEIGTVTTENGKNFYWSSPAAMKTTITKAALAPYSPVSLETALTTLAGMVAKVDRATDIVCGVVLISKAAGSQYTPEQTLMLELCCIQSPQESEGHSVKVPMPLPTEDYEDMVASLMLLKAGAQCSTKEKLLFSILLSVYFHLGKQGGS